MENVKCSGFVVAAFLIFNFTFYIAPSVQAQSCPRGSVSCPPTRPGCGPPLSVAGTACTDAYGREGSLDSCNNCTNASCVAGQVFCGSACQAPATPLCPTGSNRSYSACTGCGGCAANYTDCGNGGVMGGAYDCQSATSNTCRAPRVWNPCNQSCSDPYIFVNPNTAQTGSFNVVGQGQIGGDEILGGDLRMTGGKAIRFDQSGRAVLNIGNWGAGSTGVNVNIISGQLITPQLCLGADCRSAWPAAVSAGITEITSTPAESGILITPAGTVRNIALIGCAPNQILKRDTLGTNWTCAADATGSSGSIAHSSLTGLSNDDHPQYYRQTGDSRILNVGGELILSDTSNLQINSGQGLVVRSAAQGGAFSLRSTGTTGLLNVGIGMPAGSPITERLIVNDSNDGIGSTAARVQIRDLAQNPELQLKYGSGANDHWAWYADQTTKQARLWGTGDDPSNPANDRLRIDANGTVQLVTGQLRLFNSATAPTSPVRGGLYYDPTPGTGGVKVYTGSVWQSVGSSGALTDVTSAAGSGISVTGSPGTTRQVALVNSCANNQILKWNTTTVPPSWTCAEDVGGIGGSGTGGTIPQFSTDGMTVMDSPLTMTGAGVTSLLTVGSATTVNGNLTVGGDLFANARARLHLDITGGVGKIQIANFVSGGLTQVGIGNGEVPTETLVVSDNTGATARIKIMDTVQNPELQLQYGGTPGIGITPHWGLYVNKQIGNELRIWGAGVGGADRLAIDTSGNVSVLGGNLTLTAGQLCLGADCRNSWASSGLATSGTTTADVLTKFSGGAGGTPLSLTNSLLSESGTTVTVNGALTVAGNVTASGCFGPVFVGLTTGTTNGQVISGTLVGYRAAHNLCAQDFPASGNTPAAHMCATGEILNSVSCGGVTSPVFTATPTTAQNEAWISNGAPALSTQTNDCNGWKTPDLSSLVNGVAWQFNADGGVGWAQTCNIALQLACCR